MNGWLQQARKKSQNPFMKSILLGAAVFFSVLGLASVISDAGFAQEVQRYRVLVWGGSGTIALMVAFGHLYYYQYQELTESRKLAGRFQDDIDGCRDLIDQLQDEISSLKKELGRLEQERDSALELMKSYKAETREDTLNALQRLALLAVKQEQWREKGAKVERLRVEEVTPIEAESMYFNNLEERITVIINLGEQDEIMEGMKFSVQDPTDSHEYGVIEIRQVHPHGARCRILEISGNAFWNKAVQAAREGRSDISEASANIILPVSGLKEIPPESAKQLLSWIRSIRSLEL